MHEYASDAPDRKYAFLGMAALSAGAAWLLHVALKWANAEPWWWVEVPSVLGFYGLLFKLYDEGVWKVISGLPNLNGTWVGEIESDFGGQEKKSCVVHIDQTWTRLLVSLQTDRSRSTSTMAALYVAASSEKGSDTSFGTSRLLLQPTRCTHIEVFAT